MTPDERDQLAAARARVISAPKDQTALDLLALRSFGSAAEYARARADHSFATATTSTEQLASIISGAIDMALVPHRERVEALEARLAALEQSKGSAS
jgi:hypothetical protein